MKPNFENLSYLLLKATNLFFIFLQARIFKSEGFTKFMRVDLRSIMNMGKNYKKDIMTFMYNNKKLEKIIQVQQNRKQMIKDVD
jgi:hypothetical protein